MLKNYRELKVWQKSYKLCLDIYKVTKKFPREERYGLCSQMTRASVSVPSNIAEGYGRKTTPEYIHSLYMAYGSNCELDTQLSLAGDVGYINGDSLKGLLEKVGEVERMLMALIRSLENKLLESV